MWSVIHMPWSIHGSRSICSQRVCFFFVQSKVLVLTLIFYRPTYASVVAGTPSISTHTVPVLLNAQDAHIIGPVSRSQAVDIGAATPWQPNPGPAVNGSANDRRRNHSQQMFSTNAAFQPASSSSQRNNRTRGSSQTANHRSYPGANNSFRNASINPVPLPHSVSTSSASGDILRTYKVILLPYGVSLMLS